MEETKRAPIIGACESQPTRSEWMSERVEAKESERKLKNDVVRGVECNTTCNLPFIVLKLGPFSLFSSLVFFFFFGLYSFQNIAISTIVE